MELNINKTKAYNSQKDLTTTSQSAFWETDFSFRFFFLNFNTFTAFWTNFNA